MSFGFSVGDLIGAANLTYRLIKALHGSHDAGEEYRAAINELGCFQQALIRVSCLGSSKDYSQATFESASCIIMGSMDIIQSFLDKTKRYDRRLGAVGSSGLAQGLRKMGWTLFKAEEMKKLRETLHARLAALGVVLAAENMFVMNLSRFFVLNSNLFCLSDNGSETVRYVDVAEESIPSGISEAAKQRRDGTMLSLRPRTNISNRSHSSRSIDSGIEVEDEIVGGQRSPSSPEVTNARFQVASAPSSLFLSSLSSEELVELVSDQASREAKITEVSRLLRTLVTLGDYQLGNDEHQDLLNLLNSIVMQGEKSGSANVQAKSSIILKDAVGRKFQFPLKLCQTWKVSRIYLHVYQLNIH